MSKETIWLIIASVAPLIAVPMIYLGLQNEIRSLAAIGLGIFALGMLITPIMRLFSSAE